jgi:hypothetical protein
VSVCGQVHCFLFLGFATHQDRYLQRCGAGNTTAIITNIVRAAITRSQINDSTVVVSNLLLLLLLFYSSIGSCRSRRGSSAAARFTTLSGTPAIRATIDGHERQQQQQQHQQHQHHHHQHTMQSIRSCRYTLLDTMQIDQFSIVGVDHIQFQQSQRSFVIAMFCKKTKKNQHQQPATTTKINLRAANSL